MISYVSVIQHSVLLGLSNVVISRVDENGEQVKVLGASQPVLTEGSLATMLSTAAKSLEERNVTHGSASVDGMFIFQSFDKQLSIRVEVDGVPLIGGVGNLRVTNLDLFSGKDVRSLFYSSNYSAELPYRLI